MAVQSSGWPCQELNTFLYDLLALECEESHRIQDFCFQFQIRKIHTPYAVDQEARFVSTICELFETFYYSVCSCTHKTFEERLRNYRQLYPQASGLISELLAPPADRAVPEGSISQINDAFNDLPTLIPVDQTRKLICTMQCGLTLKVGCELTSEQRQVSGNVQRVRCRILRYMMLQNLRYTYTPSQLREIVQLGTTLFCAQLASGIGALAIVGTVAALAVIFALKNKVFINRSKPEDLSYTPLTPFVSIAYDTWSSGNGGRLTLQKSTSWGYLKLHTDNPHDATHIPFDFSSMSKDPVAPKDIWSLCNWLTWAYKNNKLPSFEALDATWSLLQKPLPNCSDQIRSIFSDSNKVILQAFQALSLSDELATGEANTLLLTMCSAFKDKKAQIQYDEYIPLLKSLPRSKGEKL